MEQLSLTGGADPHHSSFEFRNLGEGIQAIDGQFIGSGFEEMEGDKHHAPGGLFAHRSLKTMDPRREVTLTAWWSLMPSFAASSGWISTALGYRSFRL